MSESNRESEPELKSCRECPWCEALADEKDSWGWLITHKPTCYWLNVRGDSIGRVRVNFSEVEKWNTRASSQPPAAKPSELVIKAYNVLESYKLETNDSENERDFWRDVYISAVGVLNRHGVDAQRDGVDLTVADRINLLIEHSLTLMRERNAVARERNVARVALKDISSMVDVSTISTNAREWAGIFINIRDLVNAALASSGGD